MIKEMGARNGCPRPQVVMDDARGLQSETVITLLRENGISAYKPHKKDRVGHWALIRSLLSNATTGDGLTAALQILSCLVVANRPASEVLRVFEPLPQILRNVRISGVSPLEQAEVRSVVADAEARLASVGRLLIRKSGTEPLIRVMAEGEDEVLVTAVVNDVADAIQRAAT